MEAAQPEDPTMSERWLHYGDPQDDDRVPVRVLRVEDTAGAGSATQKLEQQGSIPVDALDHVPDDAEHQPGEVLLDDLTTDQENALLADYKPAGPRIDKTGAIHYARDTTQDVLARFGTEEERDRWVQFGDWHREPVPEDAASVLAAGLREHRHPDAWAGEHDPDCDATYEWTSEPTAPIPWELIRTRYDADLGLGETLAIWLRDDPDGPQLSRKQAADVLGRATGTVKKQVARAREKLNEVGRAP